MAGNVYGLDPETYEIKVFDKKKGTIWQEKDAIAMKNKRYVWTLCQLAFLPVVGKL